MNHDASEERMLPHDLSIKQVARALRAFPACLAIMIACSAICSMPGRIFSHQNEESANPAQGSAASAPYVLEQIYEKGAGKTSLLILPNGFRACIDERPGRKTVFCQISVKIGSVNEPPGLYGISHFLEHLLFKEREKNPTASRIIRRGGEMNASTSFDTTSYYCDVAVDDFEDSWTGLSDMVLKPAFTDGELNTERGVILEEISMSKSNPMAIAYYAIIKKIFPDHPLGNPIIGYTKTLKKITKDDVLSYYKRHYTPGNMFVVITGGIDSRRAAELIAGAFQEQKSSNLIPAEIPSPSRREKAVSFDIKTLVTQTYLIYGIRTAGMKSNDRIPLKLLETILGSGKNSRLYRILKEEKGITNDFMVISEAISNVGGIGIGVIVNPDRAEEAKTLVDKEIEKMGIEYVTDEELEIAKSIIRSGFIFSFETNAGISEFRTMQLRYDQALPKDEYIKQIESVSKEDIREAASRYLQDEDIIRIQIRPAHGFGKIIAALKYMIFKRI